jgi:hypothetical protein
VRPERSGEGRMVVGVRESAFLKVVVQYFCASAASEIPG